MVVTTSVPVSGSLRLGVGESWRGVVALALPVLLYNFSKLNLYHTLCGASPSLSRVAE